MPYDWFVDVCRSGDVKRVTLTLAGAAVRTARLAAPAVDELEALRTVSGEPS